MKLAELHLALKQMAFAFVVLAALFTSRTAFGQAEETGSLPFSTSVYLGGAYVTPDAGPPKDKGFIAGANITRNLRHVQPALDLRIGYATGQNIDESYFLSNIKVAKAMGPGRRIRPYGLAGIGYGKVKFPGNFTDDSVVYGAGAGLDYTITTHFAAKVDWEYQFWNLGNSTHGLTPSVLSVGISYRVRLRH